MNEDISGCVLTPTDRDFRYWSSQHSLSPSTGDAVKNADIVLLPYEGFGGYDGPLYPVGTEELFLSLRETAPTGMRIELAVEDEDYKEVAIHGDIVRIAEFLVTYVAAPAAAILVAEYLKRYLGSRFSRTEVRASMTVDQGGGDERSAVRISYEGPAATFESSLKAALGTLKGGKKRNRRPAARRSLPSRVPKSGQ
jgi:hypothetical protein